MPGLTFEDQAPKIESAPARTDIALFVGFVRLAPGVQIVEGSALYEWLDKRGWVHKPYGRAYQQLLDVPVPVDSWQDFEKLFDWQDRTGNGNDGSTYLGAAVRSFFVQGGRRCYVVRVGDPWRLSMNSLDRLALFAKVIPGYQDRFLSFPRDRYSWSGVGHVFGLPDVSFICMPDLAEAVSTDRTVVKAIAPAPAGPEEFVECSLPLEAPPNDRPLRGIGAPVCNEAGFKDWKSALDLVTGALSRAAREVELVAAVPIPEDELAFDSAPATAFLQLAYPWARTPGSQGLPDQLESPDGILAGVLARNALLRGTYASAASSKTPDLYDVFPVLDRHEQQDRRLIERVCLIGPTPSGLRLLSDVTMSLDERYRPGSVSRLIAAIVRTARRIGEEAAFESSGERLWGDIRSRLDGFMRGLYQDGAFVGVSPGDAYTIRCDRSTMTQNDLDSGRVIAQVQFDAAVPVDTITVVLIVNEGGANSNIQSEAA